MKTGEIHVSENADGTVDIGYEDYDVEYFNGMDVEVTYRLSAKNFALLLTALPASRKSIKDRLSDAFTPTFKDSTFQSFCKKHGILYRKHVWISGWDLCP